MGFKKNKFSAFKLFYDEFVYRENRSVNYEDVRRNIDNIREFTIDLRKTPKYDLNQYMMKLERINTRIKEQLDNILKVNKSFFEFYLILYKNHVSVSNDKVQDVPFILSTSFYDDYRLDNKTVFELENSTYVIPRYTSAEKKDIRNVAKRVSKIEYFMQLLKESNNCSKYQKFIDKATYLLKLKPVIKESHFDYFKRLEHHLNEVLRLSNRVDEYARECEDYEFISEKMEIAYKKKFDNWDESINSIINEYFDDLYNSMINNREIKGKFNLVNEMSYETYRETVDKLIEEKEYLIKEYENGRNVNIYDDSDSYIIQFKNVLIKAFFDTRYYKSIGINDGVDAFVNRAIELYALANDLDDQIFEKIMFDASHSPELKRGNDATTALIVKIYELYNPVYLLSIYEKARNEFEDLLDKKTIEFNREYNVRLLDKKMEYDFHGPLPTMKSIRTKIVERRKEFIFEHCVTELFSRELLDSYDTRNYDLNVVARDISIDDIVHLYHRMKDKIENFDFSNMNFVDSSLVADDYEKNLTLLSLQEFVVKNIFSKLKCKTNNDKDVLDKYIDICENYLKEEILFVDNVIRINDDTLKKFEEERIDFVRTTEWNRFLKNNKLKGSF